MNGVESAIAANLGKAMDVHFAADGASLPSVAWPPDATCLVAHAGAVTSGATWTAITSYQNHVTPNYVSPSHFQFGAATGSVYTVPTGVAGIFNISISAQFAANATGTRGVAIIAGGTSPVNPWTASSTVAAVTGAVTAVSTSCTVSLQPGDTIVFRVQQNSGGTLAVKVACTIAFVHGIIAGQ
jgi:hypothetical protein